jgi:pre-rRNA-processing protein TSR1
MLKVTGYARGNPLNANRLVQLQNYGDYQIQQITSAGTQPNQGTMQEDVTILDTPSPEE